MLLLISLFVAVPEIPKCRAYGQWNKNNSDETEEKQKNK